MKVNLGCGQAYMEGWVNVDEMPDVKADVYANAFEFVEEHGAEIEELYMGHFLEHLLPADSESLLRLIVQRLPAGAQVSAVTPDIRAIFRAYEMGEIDNETLNSSFIYSYVQPSHHVWCYDTQSLLEVFTEAGMVDIRPIDPLTWPPVFHKDGPESRWQCGVAGAVPTRRPQIDSLPESPAALPSHIRKVSYRELPATTTEMLLVRIERLREELDRQYERREFAENAARAQEAEISRLRQELEHTQHDLRMLQSTRSYRVARTVQAISDAAVPKGSERRRLVASGAAAARELRRAASTFRSTWSAEGPASVALEAPADRYSSWAAAAAATDEALAQQHHVALNLEDPLTILVIIKAIDRPELISNTVRSLLGQSWPHWQAVVLVPESKVEEAWRVVDARVRLQPTEGAALYEHINMVLSRNDSEDFVIVAEAGDLFAFDCLYELAVVATQDPLIDLVYWDDDIRTLDGRRHSPRFRPEWSPEILLGRNYLGLSFALRIRRLMMFGALQTHFGGSAFWDLLARVQLDETRVKRVPRVLQHLVSERSDDASEAGVTAVQHTILRNGWPAVAELEPTGMVRVRWDLAEWPKVSIIVPTRHNRPMLERSLTSVATSDYVDYEIIVVDNGEHTRSNEAFYDRAFPDVPLRVEWWTTPFNYSAVNNRGAELATGDVLVFLNDDTEVTDPEWLKELVGWATRDGVGVVGPHLVGLDGRLQFGGTILGLNGFAEHLFAGLEPHADTIFGPVQNYRNVLAVTGACLAVTRKRFEEVGGFDERFVLCGSDVAIGLDMKLLGYRNVCTPVAPLVHLESATRGSNVPEQDFFASFWRYQSWLFGGDPYFSPNLSLTNRIPALRLPSEPSVQDMIAPALGRRFSVFRQRADAGEAQAYADTCRASEEDVRAIKALHEANRAPFEPETVNWFIPDLDSPFYGGINTVFRIADHLARNHGVSNRFVVWGPGPERYVRSGMAAAFPALGDCPIVFHDGSIGASLRGIPEADVSIATLWVTAYQLAHFPGTRRKFYLVQDFEPVFNPAGTLYALAEESYRLGLYGLCNTEVMQRIYNEEYGGIARAFVPAVDQTVFHAEGRPAPEPDRPVTIFVYARAGHWRNCWELASLALKEVKQRLGDRVRIVAAGSWAQPDGSDLDPVVKHVGLLDYRATGRLYRNCDIGLALTVSKHPSYLPLELMACGVPVVAFDSPHFHWLLRHGENSLLAPRTVDGVADALQRLVLDGQLRHRLSAQGVSDIAAAHSSWEKALAGVYGFLSDPEGVG